MLTILDHVRALLWETIRPIDGSDPKTDDVTSEQALEEILGMLPDGVDIDVIDSDDAQADSSNKRTFVVSVDRELVYGLTGRSKRSDLTGFLSEELSTMLIDELGYEYQGYGEYSRGAVTVMLNVYNNTGFQITVK